MQVAPGGRGGRGGVLRAVAALAPPRGRLRAAAARAAAPRQAHLRTGTTTTAPPPHHHRTTTVPPPHHHCTTTAPPHHSKFNIMLFDHTVSFKLNLTFALPGISNAILMIFLGPISFLITFNRLYLFLV